MKQSSAVTAALGEHTLTITITRSFRSPTYAVEANFAHPTGPRTMYISHRREDPRLEVLDAVSNFLEDTSAQILAAGEFLRDDPMPSASRYLKGSRGHMAYENTLVDLEALARADADPPTKADPVPARKRKKRAPKAEELDSYLLGVGTGRREALQHGEAVHEAMAMTGDSITGGLPALNPEPSGLIDAIVLNKTKKAKKKKTKRKIAKKPTWR